MRSFIVATVILCVIIMLTAVNSVYVTARVEEMLSVCENLKSSSHTMLNDELLMRWYDCRDIISLTTHRSEIDRAENALLSLKNNLNHPNEYYSHLSILISVLEHIRDSQSFSVDNIF